MKRFALILAAIVLAFNGFAQKQPKFSIEDAKQFYRTIQGDYSMQVNDSTTAMVRFTPIWENESFQWFYLEASLETKVVLQKILEIVPKTNKTFKVVVHNIKDPGLFVGKWANRNFFDGYNKSILANHNNLTFVKTADFSYQMNGFKSITTLECFPKGDILHVKFVQEDERFYIKRMPKGTNRILGYEGLKEISE
ncbi:MAG: hypothetical protein IJQ11_07365 [Bacteroidales bacterium]|nr:hypothetical protein [Bacteroidales bacterium]